jgi:hypothetical protein
MKKQGLHLLWAVPAALLVWYALLVGSVFTWCGVFGCLRPGRDLQREVGPTWALLALGGVIVALPFLAVEWTTSKGARITVAIVIAVIGLGAGWLYLYLAGWH